MALSLSLLPHHLPASSDDFLVDIGLLGNRLPRFCSLHDELPQVRVDFLGEVAVDCDRNLCLRHPAPEVDKRPQIVDCEKRAIHYGSLPDDHLSVWEDSHKLPSVFQVIRQLLLFDNFLRIGRLLPEPLDLGLQELDLFLTGQLAAQNRLSLSLDVGRLNAQCLRDTTQNFQLCFPDEEASIDLFRRGADDRLAARESCPHFLDDVWRQALPHGVGGLDVTGVPHPELAPRLRHQAATFTDVQSSPEIGPERVGPEIETRLDDCLFYVEGGFHRAQELVLPDLDRID